MWSGHTIDMSSATTTQPAARADQLAQGKKRVRHSQGDFLKSCLERKEAREMEKEKRLEKDDIYHYVFSLAPQPPEKQSWVCVKINEVMYEAELHGTCTVYSTTAV